MGNLNPFSELIEDKYAPYSWALRTSFWQKVTGVFQLFFGTLLNSFLHHTRKYTHVGLLEYGMLFLPALIEKFIYELAVKGPRNSISSHLIWLLACALTPIVFLTLTLPRFLIAVTLTALCLPFIRLAHWISEKKSALYKENLEPFLNELKANDLNKIWLAKVHFKKSAVLMEFKTYYRKITLELKFLSDIAANSGTWLALRQLNIGDINTLWRMALKLTPNGWSYPLSNPSLITYKIQKFDLEFGLKDSYFNYREKWTPPGQQTKANNRRVNCRHTSHPARYPHENFLFLRTHYPFRNNWSHFKVCRKWSTLF